MDNRSTILECALQLFAARGYDAIGVQEICESAGVTKPTLYHYFGNKRGLLEVVVQERSASLLRDVAQAATYSGDLPLNLQRVTETYFRFAIRESTFYRMLLTLLFPVPAHDAFQVVATLNQQQVQLLEDLFRAASHDHGNMRGRQRAYAATFLGMINTYIGLAFSGDQKLNAAAVRQAVHQFSHGIYS